MQKIAKSLIPKAFRPEFLVFGTPNDLYMHMQKVTEKYPKTIYRNFIGSVECVTRESIIIENELFPKDALVFYTKHNMGLVNYETNPDLYKQFYNSQRGGGQGDYSLKFPTKFQNLVDCLTKFPASKRAVLTMPYAKKLSPDVKHDDDEEQKCLRELHFFIEDGVLHCSGFMRAQAVIIFPKNMHFIGTVMLDLAEALKVHPGSYTHFVTNLVESRE